MAFALEQSDIRIAAEADIKVSVTGGFFEEPDVTGVHPIVTAGGDHFFPAWRSRHWRRLWERRLFFDVQEAISNLVISTKLFTLSGRSNSIVGPDVWMKT